MTYKPRRTARFDHATDLIEFLEAAQCHTCQHREEKPADDVGPMCHRIALDILLEETIEDLVEYDTDEIVCNAFKVQT